MWLAAGRLREALRCEQHSEATLEAAVLDHVLGPKIRARQSTRKEQGYNRLSGLDGVRGRARAGSGPSKTPRVGGSNHVGVDPSKRSAPGFAVSGDGGVDLGALRPSHRARRPATVVDGLE